MTGLKQDVNGWDVHLLPHFLTSVKGAHSACPCGPFRPSFCLMGNHEFPVQRFRFPVLVITGMRAKMLKTWQIPWPPTQVNGPKTGRVPCIFPVKQNSGTGFRPAAPSCEAAEIRHQATRPNGIRQANIFAGPCSDSPCTGGESQPYSGQRQSAKGGDPMSSEITVRSRDLGSLSVKREQPFS